MLSVIIRDDGEKSVVELTYQNLWKELKDIAGTELLVASEWFSVLDKIDNNYVCFVEADCLVNSGYFSSQLGLFKKNSYFRKLAMLSSSVGVNDWANKFYGYSLGDTYADGVQPVREKKSTAVYPVQIGYFPGSIVRASMLKEALSKLKIYNSREIDLVYLSTVISLAFWGSGIGDNKASFSGNRVHINPNTTYVTTEDSVNDIGRFEHTGADVVEMFRKESI